MGIQITREFRQILDERQRQKYAAIRKEPIYDREIWIPVRETRIRCLEYIPKEVKGNLPVVFDIHGGGFTNGYPEEDDLICRKICDQLKVRVFSIDYRLAPDYPYPEGFLDVYETIHYIWKQAEQYQILPDKMAAFGHSAGANYALTSCMKAIMENSFEFRCLVLDYPPLDMATPAAQKFYIEGGIPIHLSDVFDACYRLPEQAKEPLCSPVFADDELLKKLPPVTMISCEIDSLRAEEEEFAARLSKLGVEVLAKRFLGQKHAFNVNYDNPVSDEAHRMAIESIKRYFE